MNEAAMKEFQEQVRADAGRLCPLSPFEGMGLSLQLHFVNGRYVDPRRKFFWYDDALAAFRRVWPDFDPKIPHWPRVKAMLIADCGLRADQVEHMTVIDIIAQLERWIAPDPKPHLMTDGQREVWEALDGRCLNADELAAPEELDTSPEAVWQRVSEMRKLGCEVETQHGRGYFRPDSPPDDLGTSTPT